MKFCQGEVEWVSKKKVEESMGETASWDDKYDWDSVPDEDDVLQDTDASKN